MSPGVKGHMMCKKYSNSGLKLKVRQYQLAPEQDEGELSSGVKGHNYDVQDVQQLRAQIEGKTITKKKKKIKKKKKKN